MDYGFFGGPRGLSGDSYSNLRLETYHPSSYYTVPAQEGTGTIEDTASYESAMGKFYIKVGNNYVQLISSDAENYRKTLKDNDQLVVLDKLDYGNNVTSIVLGKFESVLDEFKVTEDGFITGLKKQLKNGQLTLEDVTLNKEYPIRYIESMVPVVEKGASKIQVTYNTKTKDANNNSVNETASFDYIHSSNPGAIYSLDYILSLVTKAERDSYNGDPTKIAVFMDNDANATKLNAVLGDLEYIGVATATNNNNIVHFFAKVKTGENVKKWSFIYTTSPAAAYIGNATTLRQTDMPLFYTQSFKKVSS